MMSRPELIAAGAVASGGAVLLSDMEDVEAAQAAGKPADGGSGMEPGQPGVRYQPVEETPLGRRTRRWFGNGRR